MKVTDLITRLQEVLKKHGDIQVLCRIECEPWLVPLYGYEIYEYEDEEYFNSGEEGEYVCLY